MYKIEYKKHGSNQKKMKFCLEEDKKLTKLVSLYGEDWTQIIQFLPGRSVRQVMERWKFYLDPSINNDPWTPEEDKKLLDYQVEYGNKWTKMLRFFKNRTANQLKNRWLGLERKSRSKVHNKQSKISKNHISNSILIESSTIKEIRKPIKSLPSIDSINIPKSNSIEIPFEIFMVPTLTNINPVNNSEQKEMPPLRKPISKIPSIADFLN